MSLRTKRIRGTNIMTPFVDLMMILLICLMPMIAGQAKELDVVKTVAAKVPDYEETIEGLQGTVDTLSEGLTNSEEEGAILRAIIAKKDDLIGEQQTIIKGLNSDLDKIKSRLKPGDPVTVMILIDVTNSMQPAIDELRVTLATICEITGNLSKDFRVGIIAFRDGSVAEFPITRIAPKYEDNGESQAKVLAFVNGLKPKRSSTEHLAVFEKAIGMLRAAHPEPDASRRERIVFIGDVFTNELDDYSEYTNGERRIARRIVGGLKKWAQQGNRAVESLYADTDGPKTHPWETESRKWFRAIGSVSPKSAAYDDTSSLLHAVLHASHE